MARKKISEATSGEKTALNGTEQFPISGNQYVQVSSTAEYIRTLAQTLTNKTLTAPTIADFTNAAHDHGDTDDGGAVVSASATVSGVVELATDAEAIAGTDTVRAITAANLRAVLMAIYYVGSLHISTVSTNPNTLYGFGTWVAFGTGRTLVAIDAGQTEFDTVEETGGAKTHTLITAEMPSHTHPPSGADQFAYTSAIGQVASGTAFGAVNTFNTVTGATGGDGAHNNLQPYIVVYMWKRTA